MYLTLTLNHTWAQLTLDEKLHHTRRLEKLLGTRCQRAHWVGERFMWFAADLTDKQTTIVLLQLSEYYTSHAVIESAHEMEKQQL